MKIKFSSDDNSRLNKMLKLYMLTVIVRSVFEEDGNCFFFNCYLAAPRPTLGHYRGGSLTPPMLITCVLHIRPEGHREPRRKVGCLSLAERLGGFESGTFRF